jgi:hypothetical protein
VQERCLTLNCYGLAISLAYPSGEERRNLLAQIISNYRHRLRGRGKGSAPGDVAWWAGLLGSTG